MNRKKAVVAGGIIALLLLLNLRQWLSGDETQAGVSTSAAAIVDFAEQDFRLDARAGLQPSPGVAAVKRDLFFASPARAPARAVKPAQVAAGPAPDAAKGAGPAAPGALDSFTLVGIVYNQGRYQAFIIRDDKTYTGDEGKLLDGRYLVESVDGDSVTLIDTETGLKKRVELTGDESS